MRKYILIPEYRPLYAMRHCWGPSYGPLWKPTLTPVDVIGELLLQSGNEKLSIFEVVKLANSNRFSEPIQLFLENYRLPYEEIVARSKQAEKPVHGDISVETPFQTEPTVSLPTLEDDDIADETVEEVPAAPTDETEDVDPIEPLVEKIRENFGADAVVEESAKIADETPKANTENPYAGMTKAQRRAARRAARQAEQQTQETEEA